jgi:Zn finger protein HypA/HybF involved in hydrogenase expression
MTLATVEITCGACGFSVPSFARQVVLQKDNLQTSEFVCPTCKSVFRVCVQQTRRTTLTPAKLEELRNKNR